MFSAICDAMVELGYDPTTCNEIIPEVFEEFAAMGLLQEIDGDVFLDLREKDLSLTTWDYLVANGKLDQGTIEKITPVIEFYRQNGDSPELGAMVEELNTNLDIYDPDTITKILTFKDVFEHSEDYWEYYGHWIGGPGSVSLCDALGTLVGGVPGGLVGGVIFAGGWSYLHERFVVWYNAH